MEGLPCSPESRDCPDGQECGGDNVCRQAGGVAPVADAEPCSVTECDVEVLSTSGTSADVISAAHPEYVFWTSSGDRQVFRTSKVNLQTDVVDDGGPPYEPLGLAADASRLFWSDSRISGAILARAADGDGNPQNLVAGQDTALYVATDDDSVYWSNAGGLVLRASKQGGALSMVAASLGDGPAGSLVLDSARVYFADQGGGRVFSVAKDGSDELTTVSANQGAPLGVGVDAEHVYWANTATGEIKRRSVTGGPVETVVEQQLGAAFLVVGPGHVYWTNRDDGRVMRLDKATLTSEALVEGQAQPYGIALDGDALYWVNQNGANRVMRIHPCACP
ncbi:MAG TPA: hypothetical protein VNO33_09075 [Kofleriaceae bacterium]|nr:hypothetical protein [Kofleriaceae bacterium]